jgi:hypothetical protein
VGEGGVLRFQLDGRSRWGSGPAGEVSGPLLGEVVHGVVEELQVSFLLLG